MLHLYCIPNNEDNTVVLHHIHVPRCEADEPLGNLIELPMVCYDVPSPRSLELGVRNLIIVEDLECILLSLGDDANDEEK